MTTVDIVAIYREVSGWGLAPDAALGGLLNVTREQLAELLECAQEDLHAAFAMQSKRDPDNHNALVEFMTERQGVASTITYSQFVALVVGLTVGAVAGREAKTDG